MLLLCNQCIITINGFLRLNRFFINLAPKKGKSFFLSHPFIILSLNLPLDSKASQCFPMPLGRKRWLNSHSEIPPCLFQVGNPAPPLLSNALMRGHSSTCSRVLCPFPALFTRWVHRQMPRHLYTCPCAPCQPSPMCTHSFPVLSPVLHNPCISKRLVHRSCTPRAFTS